DLSVLNNLMFREPTLITPVGASGGFEADGRPTVYLRALNIIERGEIDVAPLITHRYASLEAVQDALIKDIHLPGYIKGVVTLYQAAEKGFSRRVAQDFGVRRLVAAFVHCCCSDVFEFCGLRSKAATSHRTPKFVFRQPAGH